MINSIQRNYVLLTAGILLIGIILGFLIGKYAEPQPVNINIDVDEQRKPPMAAEDAQASYAQLLDHRRELAQALESQRRAYSNLEKENSRLRGDLVNMQNQLSSLNIGDELAPGYNRCIERARNDFDMKDCSSAAAAYWDKRLTDLYKSMVKDCARDANPALCARTIKNLENRWITYRDDMSKFIYNGGSYRPVGGTAQRFLGIDFLAQEMKKQCVILESLFQQ